MKWPRFLSWPWLVAAALVLIALGVVGFGRLSFPAWLFAEAEPAGSAVPLEPECLGRVDVEGGVRDLAPVRGGRVAELLVKEGEDVSAGTVLLRLDEEPARLQILQAQAGRDAALTQLALAEEAARLHPGRIAAAEALWDGSSRRVAAAKEGLRLKERMHAQRLISDEELAAATEEVRALEAVARAEEKKLQGLREQNPALQVAQAQAEVGRAKALLAEPEYARTRCVLVAPGDGTVLRVLTGVGEVVAPETPVLQFAPAGPRIVRAEVEQEFLHRIKPGQAVVIKDEIRPELSWPGRVQRVGDWFAPQPALPRQPPRFADVATVECEITFDPPAPPLRIGHRVTVLFRDGAPPAE